MIDEKVVVIGAGQMGSQIAALSAMAGLDTNLYDEDETCLLYTSDAADE